MTDRIYIYGAGSGYTINYELRATDGTLVDSGVATETAPLSGTYYVTVPALTPVAYYDMLALYQGSVIGHAAHFWWDGTQVVDEQSVWDETAANHIDNGTTGELLSQTAVDVGTAISLLQLLLKYEKNRTRIDKNACTLTVYDDNGTTPLKVFDLKDSLGAPSITDIIERNPQ